MRLISKIPKVWLAGIGGLLLGVLIILTIRFFTYDAGYVHYHANFAVYINGEREKFAGSTYYEEETSCKVKDHMTPEDRAHMHMDDGKAENDVVHVHDHAVTWGQFFENLGWVVGKDFIRTRNTLYVNHDKMILNIILNGQNLTGFSSITNRIIGNEDKLLLSYGQMTNEQLKQQYLSISSSAKKHNLENDPASCSGPNTTSLSDRLKHLF